MRKSLELDDLPLNLLQLICKMGTVPAHMRKGSHVNDNSSPELPGLSVIQSREGSKGSKSKKPFYCELVRLSASPLFSECIFARLAGVYRETFIIVSA